MNYHEFLERVIEDGIASAKKDSQLVAHPRRLEGAVQGFEECRGRTPPELAALLADAERTSSLAYNMPEEDLEEYWAIRYRALQIGWVCNCVSAIMHNEGLPTIVNPTARGYIKASEVVGVLGMP